jgi:SHS family lactate transporter-like MFS transporter
LRALYGVGMGGEWGVCAAPALETLPTESRGLASGILQEGYATGYLLAAVAYFFALTVFAAVFILMAIGRERREIELTWDTD